MMFQQLETTHLINLFRIHKSIYWAIAEIETDKIIGTIGFENWDRNHNKAELAYDLNKNYWGKQIMSKAIKAVVDFSIKSMKIHRVECYMPVENIRSSKFLEKNNFHFEGTLRDFRYFKGKYRNIKVYSFLENDQ